MAYIYVCHVCLYVFMPFDCYICANGCKLVQMYAPLHITSITHKKPSKIRLHKYDTTHRDTIRILTPLIYYALKCCITLYHQIVLHCAMQSLMVYRMGLCSATEAIIEFRRYLVNYTEMSESEAKFIIEMNLADWLNAFVLHYNFSDLYAMTLYSK